MEHRMNGGAETLKATHFPHDADIGICGMGPTPEKAFEQAALAMTAVVTDPANIRLTESVNVECRAPNVELLLVDWLNGLIFEMATRGMIFGDFGVHIEGLRLHGVARGEPISVERHNPAVEIKGATLTELCVREDRPGEWRAQCVVDV
jgi:tRNA nucleotidyltransferase (CCA-adding enzyme)